jgi:hypothetical protein
MGKNLVARCRIQVGTSTEKMNDSATSMATTSNITNTGIFTARSFA